MATTTKKGSKNTKAKPRRAAVKSSPAKQAQTIAELRQELGESLQRENEIAKELQKRSRDLTEVMEHQTATAEVLGIISRSPTDVQPILDAIVESAARVCGIDDVLLRLHERNAMIPRAHFGPIPIGRVEIGIDEPEFRWMREHGTFHIPDIREHKDFPMVATSSWRTFLSAPLHQRGELIGALTARRTEVRPFTPAQIKLLETFADQAVIAIENVRLFQELNEALEQQTATSEILGVIASSPTEFQPVLDAVARNAAGVCGATDATIILEQGGILRKVAGYGLVPGSPIGREWSMDRNTVAGRVFVERQTIHINDFLEVASDYFSSRAPREGYRTMLGTPLLREGVPIGTIAIRRKEVRPFTEKQIKLLETFASQAVIAIENVRLFKEIQERNAELREALEHQTATSEVLGIISRSPTDVQPVFDAVATSAARLCEANDAHVFRVEGDVIRRVAAYGSIPFPRTDASISRATPAGRAVVDRQTIHVHDLAAEM